MTNKYSQLLSVQWQSGLVYPISLFVWRIRQFLVTFMSLSIWGVLFANQDQLSGYTQPEMFTYIFVVSILQSLILSTALSGLSYEVYSGSISHILLRPINFFAYLITVELDDKLKNSFFSIIEFIILFFLIKPEFFIPPLITMLVLFFWILGGIMTYFLIQLLFGAVGFWSPDTWAFRFLFVLVLEITAGKMFPLDILPSILQTIIKFTPFPYLSFAQTQLFLGKLSTQSIIFHSVMIIFWMVLLGTLSANFWRKGLRNYEASGQ